MKRINAIKEGLISQQALEIAELEEKVKMYEEINKKIYTLLYCVGGALNDNKLKYTHEQQQVFFEIAGLLGNE